MPSGWITSLRTRICRSASIGPSSASGSAARTLSVTPAGPKVTISRAPGIILSAGHSPANAEPTDAAPASRLATTRAALIFPFNMLDLLRSQLPRQSAWAEESIGEWRAELKYRVGLVLIEQ